MCLERHPAQNVCPVSAQHAAVERGMLLCYFNPMEACAKKTTAKVLFNIQMFWETEHKNEKKK